MVQWRKAVNTYSFTATSFYYRKLQELFWDKWHQAATTLWSLKVAAEMNPDKTHSWHLRIDSESPMSAGTPPLQTHCTAYFYEHFSTVFIFSFIYTLLMSCFTTSFSPLVVLWSWQQISYLSSRTSQSVRKVVLADRECAFRWPRLVRVQSANAAAAVRHLPQWQLGASNCQR